MHSGVWLSSVEIQWALANSGVKSSFKPPVTQTAEVKWQVLRHSSVLPGVNALEDVGKALESH